jgi:flavin-dependent dehydrogenase
MKLLSDQYDAVIVGGGPAGASAAIHLAMRGARVFLAEQKKFPREKLCGEFISPECLEHFACLGVADEIESADGAPLSETIFYARNGSSVNIPSNWFGRANASALGLSRAEMDTRLLARARDVGVEVYEEACATDLLFEGERVDGVQFKTSDGDTFSTRALVTIDATGRTRSLARRVEKRIGDKSTNKKSRPRLVAFKTHLAGAEGSPGQCEIYVYRGGYGGLNSIENGLSNLCFIASARDVRACNGDAERVVREVVETNQRAALTLAHAKNVSPWIAVALDGFGRRRLDPAVGLITIGDAASFIDPFTGSGMLMALESGELAAAAVMRHLSGLRQREAFQTLADHYRKIYNRRFASRLRVCAGLRRAAFIPKLAEAMIFAISASDVLRRKLARATRASRMDAGSTAS